MINEKELLLRGFTTPADTDGDLQKAIDTAKALDIGKVVIPEDHTEKETVLLPAGIHLVVENATLTASLAAKAPANCAFALDRIYIEGRGGTLCGDISLYNTQNAVIEKLTVNGNIDIAFARKTRIEDVTLSGTLAVGRGTAVLIAQRLAVKEAVIESIARKEDVMGLEPTVRSVALRDSTAKEGVRLTAAEDYGLLNVQADHITGDVTIGVKDAPAKAENYFNVTVSDITGNVSVHAETKNLSL